MKRVGPLLVGDRLSVEGYLLADREQPVAEEEILADDTVGIGIGDQVMHGEVQVVALVGPEQRDLHEAIQRHAGVERGYFLDEPFAKPIGAPAEIAVRDRGAAARRLSDILLDDAILSNKDGPKRIVMPGELR